MTTATKNTPTITTQSSLSAGLASAAAGSWLHQHRQAPPPLSPLQHPDENLLQEQLQLQHQQTLLPHQQHHHQQQKNHRWSLYSNSSNHSSSSHTDSDVGSRTSTPRPSSSLSTTSSQTSTATARYIGNNYISREDSNNNSINSINSSSRNSSTDTPLDHAFFDFTTGSNASPKQRNGGYSKSVGGFPAFHNHLHQHLHNHHHHSHSQSHTQHQSQQQSQQQSQSPQEQPVGLGLSGVTAPLVTHPEPPLTPSSLTRPLPTSNDTNQPRRQQQQYPHGFQNSSLGHSTNSPTTTVPHQKTLPVKIPTTTLEQNHHLPTPGQDSFGNHHHEIIQSPPSATSSEASSPNTMGAGSLPTHWTTLPRAKERVGLHRPRHSLSVKVVRRRTSSGASSPVTSGSYSSLTPSPAVSFLANLADISRSRGPAHGDYSEGDQVGDFLLGKEVGAGAFSRVFEAQVIDGPHKALGLVAVKIVKKDFPKNDLHAKCADLQKQMDRETTIWARLRHPHVLEMLELMDTEDATFIVSELAPNGNLLDLIRSRGKLDEDLARRLFGQIAGAVRYLHQEIGVVHRDIKCENILLDANWNAKLADFGLSSEISAPSSSPPSDSPSSSSDDSEGYCQGSLHYCAPEELKHPPPRHPIPASDVWSLGCVLFAMLTGSLPFNDGFLPRLQSMIVNGRWDSSKLAGVGKDARELVTGMLRVRVQDRMGMYEVLGSRWVSGE
ncbi:kinase-like domain-containing protein [Phlyctochytrium arcticum]|nr:kinase-like domain-containing protein [Phlyctochytrium arcticum]